MSERGDGGRGPQRAADGERAVFSRRGALVRLGGGLAALAGVTGAARPMPAAAADCPLRSFEARYTLRWSAGVPVGEANISLRKDASGAYTMRSHLGSKGIVKLFVDDVLSESVSGVFAGDVPLPVRYDQSHVGGDKDHLSGAEFDWAAMTADTHYNGRTRTLKLKRRVVDPLSMYALMMSDLKRGAKISRYRIANRLKVKSYYLDHHGEDLIDTGLGQLRAWKTTRRRRGSKKLTTLWFATDHDYLPAQVVHEVDGELWFRLTLKSLQRPVGL